MKIIYISEFNDCCLRKSNSLSRTMIKSIKFKQFSWISGYTEDQEYKINKKNFLVIYVVYIICNIKLIFFKFNLIIMNIVISCMNYAQKFNIFFMNPKIIDIMNREIWYKNLEESWTISIIYNNFSHSIKFIF
jgi:hypothetical protein